MSINSNKSPGQILGAARYIYPDTDDFGWRDITGQIQTRGVGATDPAWAQIGSSSFFGYNFDVNDVCWINYHVPHDIVPNAEIFFHTHWITNGTNAAVVKWQFEYTHALGFNQDAFVIAGTTVTAENAGPGIAYQHMISETDGQQLGDLSEPDGIVQCKITRLTNGGTDNTDGVFLLMADIHYQSTDMGTYGKAPDFYK